jgi:hypothetical protein
VKTFILDHEQARRGAAEYALRHAPDGWRVKFTPPAKSRDQEERYHAMIGDIARQYEFMGQRLRTEDMKRLLVDAFARVMREAGTPLHHDGRILPSLDGRGFVQLGCQTKEFRKTEASQFIEYLLAFGAENGIVWSE